MGTEERKRRERKKESETRRRRVRFTQERGRLFWLLLLCPAPLSSALFSSYLSHHNNTPIHNSYIPAQTTYTSIYLSIHLYICVSKHITDGCVAVVVVMRSFAAPAPSPSSSNIFFFFFAMDFSVSKWERDRRRRGGGVGRGSGTYAGTWEVCPSSQPRTPFSLSLSLPHTHVHCSDIYTR